MEERLNEVTSLTGLNYSEVRMMTVKLTRFYHPVIKVSQEKQVGWVKIGFTPNGGLGLTKIGGLRGKVNRPDLGTTPFGGAKTRVKPNRFHLKARAKDPPKNRRSTGTTWGGKHPTLKHLVKGLWDKAGFKAGGKSGKPREGNAEDPPAPRENPTKGCLTNRGPSFTKQKGRESFFSPRKNWGARKKARPLQTIFFSPQRRNGRPKTERGAFSTHTLLSAGPQRGGGNVFTQRNSVGPT